MSEKLIQQKEGEKKRQARMKTLEKNIAQMQHDVDNPAETENLADIHEELVRLPPFLCRYNRDIDWVGYMIFAAET